MRMDSSASTLKPRLRGMSHQIACCLAIVAGVPLVVYAPSVRATAACAVYALSLVLLFGISATYHRVNWQTVESRQLMRRLDHAAIYGLIAGTYTPICLLALEPRTGTRLLALVWGGAALGVVKTVLFPRAPKPFSAMIYVLLGCALLSCATTFAKALQRQGMLLVLAGGAAYAVGSLVYALKRPNPWPQVFGYHEVFHLLVIGAAACHFAAIVLVVGRL